MSWVRKPTGFEMIRRAAALVDEVYRDYRNRGLRAEHAREQTAMRFQISPRRVRSFLEGDVGSVLEEHWQDLRHKFLAHLDDEAEHALRRAAQRTATRKRLQQERDKTLEMRRGVDGTGEGMLRAGVAGVGDLVAVPADREIPGLDRSENVDPGCEREDTSARGCATVTRD